MDTQDEPLEPIDFEELLTEVREITAEVLPAGWRVHDVNLAVSNLLGHDEANFCVQISLAGDGRAPEPFAVGQAIQERLRRTWAREELFIEIILPEEEL